MRDAPDLGHAFSNRIHFRACGHAVLVELSTAGRGRKKSIVRQKNRGKTCPPTSMSGGLNSLLVQQVTAIHETRPAAAKRILSSNCKRGILTLACLPVLYRPIQVTSTVHLLCAFSKSAHLAKCRTHSTNSANSNNNDHNTRFIE